MRTAGAACEYYIRFACGQPAESQKQINFGGCGLVIDQYGKQGQPAWIIRDSQHGYHNWYVSVALPEVSKASGAVMSSILV